MDGELECQLHGRDAGLRTYVLYSWARGARACSLWFRSPSQVSCSCWLFPTPPT